MEMRDGKRYTAGTMLAGGLVGAGLMLLFAPHSGKRTRREIRHFGKKAWNKAESMKLGMGHSIGNLKEDIGEGFDRTWSWTDRAANDVKHAWTAGRDYIGTEIGKLRRM